MTIFDIVLGLSVLVAVTSVPILLVLVIRTRSAIMNRQRATSLPDADVVIDKAQALYNEARQRLESTLTNKQRLLDAEAQTEIESRLNTLRAAEDKIAALKRLHKK